MTEIQDGGPSAAQGDAGGSPAAAPAPASSGESHASASTGSASPASSPASSSPAASNWLPEDWKGRAAMALDPSERGKAASFLERRDLSAVIKSGLHADARINELTKAMEGRIAIPGENATDEERAAYRAAMGIPSQASDYEIWAPEGRAWDDFDPHRDQ